MTHWPASAERLKEDPRVARVDSIAELGLPRELPQDPAKLAAFIRDNPETAARAFSLVDVEGGSRTTMMKITTVHRAARK